MNPEPERLKVVADLLRELGLETLARLTEANCEEPLKVVLDHIWYLHDSEGVGSHVPVCLFCNNLLDEVRSPKVTGYFYVTAGHHPSCDWARIGMAAVPEFQALEVNWAHEKAKRSDRARTAARRRRRASAKQEPREP